ncbi:MAG: DUF255 domain-containing protein [Chitinophagales bacterium]
MHDHNDSNHLIQEKSPYLLQHSYNPVNWYPWGDEAFTQAKDHDKLLHLSLVPLKFNKPHLKSCH